MSKGEKKKKDFQQFKLYHIWTPFKKEWKTLIESYLRIQSKRITDMNSQPSIHKLLLKNI